MNLQRREEIRAIAKEFRRLFLHEQAQAIDELLAHIDALEQAAAERVIADGSRGLMAVPEILLHDLALAAWDEGADAGMAWDPDADPAKRGVVPCTPEEGIAKARDHFAKHGSGSPSSAFSRALQAIREHSRAIPAGRVLGEGMAAVDREEWKHIVTLLGHLLCDEDAYEKADSLLEPIAKMREIRDGKAWIGIMVSDALGVSTPEIDDFFVCPQNALRANQGGAAT